MASRSKHRLKGKIVKIRRGVAIYQTHAGPYYYARILDPKTGKYKVRSTKETSRLEARKVAEELAYEMRLRIAQRSRSSASSITPIGMLRKPSARRRAESAMPTTFGRQPSP